MKFFSSIFQFFFSLIVLKQFYLSINGQSSCNIKINSNKESKSLPISQSGQIIDPINIEQTSQCQTKSLQLTFSTYKTFESFLTNPKSIHSFYDSNGIQNNLIRIDIQRLDAENEENLLSKNILRHLGGENERINTLILNISQWNPSSSDQVLSISKNDVLQGPFKQISLAFFCQSSQKSIQWELIKDKTIKSTSPCPSQIQFQSDDEENNEQSLTEQSDDENTDDQTDQSEEPSNLKSEERTYTTPIVIFIFLILVGISFALYYFVYLKRQKKKRQGSFKGDDDDAASTTSESVRSTNE